MARKKRAAPKKPGRRRQAPPARPKQRQLRRRQRMRPQKEGGGGSHHPHVNAFHPHPGRVLSLSPQPPSASLQLQAYSTLYGTASADGTRAAVVMTDPYCSKVAYRLLSYGGAGAGSFSSTPVSYTMDMSGATDIVAAAGSTAAHDRSVMVRKVCSALTVEYVGRADECSGLLSMALLPGVWLSVADTAQRNLTIATIQAHPSCVTVSMREVAGRKVYQVPFNDLDNRRVWAYPRTTEGVVTGLVPEYEGPSGPVQYTLAAMLHGWDTAQDSKPLLRVGLATKFEVQYEATSLLVGMMGVTPVATLGLVQRVEALLTSPTVRAIANVAGAAAQAWRVVGPMIG